MTELVPFSRVTPDVDSWVDVMRPIINLAEHVADTDFVPGAYRGNPAAIAAAILHGRELGLPPMTALQQTHVIDGRPALSAEGQRGLVLAAGHEMEPVELTDAQATWRGKRRGSNTWVSVTWTLDRARRAGLQSKQVWSRYPRAMLSARASAELCRAVFADVLHGMSAAEELDGYAPPTGTPELPVKSPTRAVERRTPDTPPPTTPEPPTGPTEPEEPPPLPGPEETETALPPEPVTAAQLRMLGVVWNRFGVSDDARRRFSQRMVGRDLEGTTKNLTKDEASRMINDLTRILRNLAEPEDTMSENVDPDKARAALVEWMEDKQ